MSENCWVGGWLSRTRTENKLVDLMRGRTDIPRLFRNRGHMREYLTAAGATEMADLGKLWISYDRWCWRNPCGLPTASSSFDTFDTLRHFLCFGHTRARVGGDLQKCPKVSKCRMCGLSLRLPHATYADRHRRQPVHQPRHRDNVRNEAHAPKVHAHAYSYMLRAEALSAASADVR
jgi:hypothetical protein